MNKITYFLFFSIIFFTINCEDPNNDEDNIEQNGFNVVIPLEVGNWWVYGPSLKLSVTEKKSINNEEVYILNYEFKQGYDSYTRFLYLRNHKDGCYLYGYIDNSHYADTKCREFGKEVILEEPLLYRINPAYDDNITTIAPFPEYPHPFPAMCCYCYSSSRIEPYSYESKYGDLNIIQYYISYDSYDCESRGSTSTQNISEIDDTIYYILGLGYYRFYDYSTSQYYYELQDYYIVGRE